MRHPYGIHWIIGLSVLLSHLSYANPTKTNLTQEKMFELSTLAHKDSITNGFFECATRYQNEGPEVKCLPAELKFQTRLLETVLNEYRALIKAPDQDQFKQVQKSFEDYRLTRCNWYVNHAKENDPAAKLKCVLAVTMDRRLELEKFVPEAD